MHKGLMKLNDEQLRWLGSGYGRIGNIDPQNGCPHQCIICGACAGEYKGSMPYKDHMTISDSILEVKTKKHIDVLSKDGVYPSSGSNPTNYLVKDGKIRRTIYDITKDLASRHNKEVIISTAGWNQKNKYIQEAIENIVNDITTKSMKADIGYSIKTVMPQVMKEYDIFLEKNKGQYIEARISNLKFIRESKYTTRVISNIHTLAPLNTVPNPLNNEQVSHYSLQYMNGLDIISLNDKYARYSKLFSKEFINQMRQHIEDEWYYDTPCNEQGKPYIRPAFNTRPFAGLGRALDIGIIDMSIDLEDNIKAISSDSKERIHPKEYFAQINGRGQIQIYFGSQHHLGRVLVPKEHFIRQAELAQRTVIKNKNLMLAELQGTNLLN